ncbi:hypothetical protein M422DRAFT_266401 [Sphaerobolus stellatus SS14]|uniref:Uncharacterized protein n=1 Tax=Sphaerobolus stellatus (strain SS14) TaxID=990650 RepID=A0A0C9TPF9_SPHS4|nr:hypothetical protein M422DRAFT_266401 [Sphaerobolus stellatus SS14]
MPGGRPKKHLTAEEIRQAKLVSKKAYRERNLNEEREESRERTRKAAAQARKLKKLQAVAATTQAGIINLSITDHKDTSKILNSKAIKPG